MELTIYCLLLFNIVISHSIVNSDDHVVYNNSSNTGHWLTNTSAKSSDSSSSSAGSHSGTLKTVVVIQDVLHSGDGKMYTSANHTHDSLTNATAQSVDQQIIEKQLGALKAQTESLAAEHQQIATYKKMKAIQAIQNLEEAKLLQKKKEENDAILNSPKKQLLKNIIPIVPFNSYYAPFEKHDELALKRLNDLREAALKEGDAQKHNALLHERTDTLPLIDTLKNNPQLVSDFYKSAPVFSKSAVVDPTNGNFSVASKDYDHTDSPNPSENGIGTSKSSPHAVYSSSSTPATINSDSESSDWLYG